MKKRVTGILLICLYCYPFVYFSMRQDFDNGSMRGHLVLLVATSLFAFIGGFQRSAIPILIGNVVSMVVSLYFIGQMERLHGIGWDGGYFKPLTPTMCVVFFSLFYLIPQIIAFYLGKGFYITISKMVRSRK